MTYLRYVATGFAFGFLLMKSEAISWFRIQEMFRFHSFHMYGIIGSAVVVAAAGTWLVRRLRLHTLTGGPIDMARLPWQGAGVQYWLGGALFGVGWAMTGACPGPMFALVGTGLSVMLVAIVSALLGVLAYGWLRPRLPH